ncbi:MAG TPA: hypothetical protein VGB55_13560, partial [Tepidisphaeraceae bacterium]
MHADDRSVIATQAVDFAGESGQADVTLGDAAWTVRWSHAAQPGAVGVSDVTVTFEITKGQSKATSVGIDLVPDAWSTDHYVVLPGAVYGGNRFESRSQPYPPMFEGADARLDVPVLISNVPRLNAEQGQPSALTLPTHDLTTPALGVFDPLRKAGLWILTQQRTRFGPYGLTVSESSQRDAATLSVSAPCMREGSRGWATWSDSAPDWNASNANRLLSFTVRLHRFECENVVALYEQFSDIRKDLVPSDPTFTCAPFSACVEVLQQKFNEVNWCPSEGCYATQPPAVEWQVGWVNGLVTSFGMLVCGDPESQERALKTLDFAFASQTRSGLIPGYYHAAKGWIGDGFERPGTTDWVMVRKDADALYFGLKHLLYLESAGEAHRIVPQWKTALTRLAEAFVKLWKQHGQFGQFLDVQIGEIVVGNSTAGGLVPAGLALAGQYLQRPDLLEVASASAQAYYDRWTARGVTVGGPGEILATPDSESAMAMVESFVTLYEVTGDAAWLPMATAAADQLSSWVVSYDFEFPSESTLGRLRAKATGTVFANAQNKHSAPGLCTFSGDALFRLFRATGETRHIELLRDIAGTIPQYLSRADRVVGTSPPGVICERVNLSDWEGDDRVGHVPPWSCWCESALLLTCAEVPSVYVQPDTG